MEALTPHNTHELDNFGYGGNGKVMIWGLLANDDDGEMAGMTKLLQELLVSKGVMGGRLDCPQAIKGMGKKLSGGRTLYITGHSRFLRGNGEYIPMDERLLGGYKVDEVLAELLEAVVMHDITYIELWCCETACKQGSSQWTGGADKAVSMLCDQASLKQIKAQVDSKNWAQVSTLDYLCMGLAIGLCKQMPRRFTLRVTGLNGVGYITPGDKNIVTFDQAQMLDTVNKIGALEEQIRLKKEGKYDKKSLQQAEQRFASHLQARQCHYVVYSLNTGLLKFEAEQNRDKQRELRKFGELVRGDQ